MDDPIRKAIANQAFVLLAQQTVLTLPDGTRHEVMAIRSGEGGENEILWIQVLDTDVRKHYWITVREVEITE